MSETTGPRRPLNLALQGGGSHGAFTWGVLDALLEDGRFDFEGISGRDNLKIYTTNDRYDLKLTYDGEYKQEVEIPGLSITTLIFS